MLGVRDLVRDGAPRANQVSNRISNFFLSLFTRRPLADTQCGLRRYPLPLALALGGRDDGYAFEAEIILRAVAAGVRLVEVPVRVVYPPASKRVTHFDSVRDPSRIVVRVVKTLALTSGLRTVPLQSVASPAARPADTPPALHALQQSARRGWRERRRWMMLAAVNGFAARHRKKLIALALVVIVPAAAHGYVRASTRLEPPAFAPASGEPATSPSYPDLRTLGPAYARHRGKILEVRLAGTPEQIGHQHARLLYPEMVQNEGVLYGQFEQFVPFPPARWLMTDLALLRFRAVDRRHAARVPPRDRRRGRRLHARPVRRLPPHVPPLRLPPRALRHRALVREVAADRLHELRAHRRRRGRRARGPRAQLRLRGRAHLRREEGGLPAARGGPHPLRVGRVARAARRGDGDERRGPRARGPRRARAAAARARASRCSTRCARCSGARTRRARRWRSSPTSRRWSRTS